MKNSGIVGSMSRHLSKTAERINELASDLDYGVKDNDEVSAMYTDLLLDQLEQAQKLVLALTNTVTDSLADSEGGAVNTDGDGSVFAQGELQSVSGENLENPVQPEKEDA